MTLRIHSLLLSMAMASFFFGTTAFAAKPLSPNTSFETTDGATAPLVGELVSGTGDGPGWLDAWSSDYLPEDIVYDNSRSTTGQWSMLLDTVDRLHHEPQIGRVFAKSIKKGLLLIRAQIDRTNRNGLNVFISGKDPHINNVGAVDPSGQAIFFSIVPEKYYNTTPGGSDISATDGGVETFLADDAIAPNVWHEFLIEFNCNKDGGIYDVYLNGNKLNSEPLHFRFPQESLDRIHINTGSGQNSDGSSSPIPGAKHWIEDIVVWRK